MLDIYVPTIDGHNGCCFREILKIWEENKWVKLHPIEKNEFNRDLIGSYIESYVWVGGLGLYLLYDKPTWDTRIRFGFQKLLMANEFVPFRGAYKWTFWVTHPKVYEDIRKQGIKSYQQRNHTSIFYGSGKHRGNRNEEWGEVIENFSLDDTLPMSYKEYIKFICNHKFGLSLTGVGPKCLRDIEYMGMGVVPLFTREVSVEYYNKLEQNVHYLLVDDIHHAKDVIENTTQEQWEYISSNVVKWYEENATVESIFKLTKKILYEID